MLGLKIFDERADRSATLPALPAATRSGPRPGERTEPRFAALLPLEDWRRLPEAVRWRFSTVPADGNARVYVGTVTETRLSRAGWLLAQLSRLAGSPLPFDRDTVGPATVTVAENRAIGGQVWTRTYARRGGFPQTINSAKRFTGPTGLEEYLGSGLIMHLTLRVDARADLVFESAGYAVSLAGRRLALPAWLSPGRCEIRHRDLGAGRFAFILDLAHPWFGTLVHQSAEFREAIADPLASPRSPR